MPFENYVCWDTGRIRRVMNTSAEHASRPVFLAVHSEYPLIVSSPRGGTVESNDGWSIQPEEFLNAFLSKDNPHMQVAVLGNSGSGKSHFISWMKYSLPESANRHTISIPRTGVSLRGVLERIIDALPEAARQPYLDELNHAGSQNSSPQDLEERLISEIALAIRSDQVIGKANQDLEGALIQLLPDIFNDPVLRRHFRRPGGVIEGLSRQVLSASHEYIPAEDRRDFTTEDLPLTGVQTAEMSVDARQTCDFLRSNLESQDLAVGIINRNLNKAIGQVLNFTGDRLIGLLQDVRRHLRRQGKELVLLVEDLARLQGLDLSLLEALIDEGNEANGLCDLRWAAAVTTGYYTRLPNTVHTRMNFVLQMDIPTEGAGGSIGARDIVAFAAKYLNASRARDEELVDWADQPEEDRTYPPNACELCVHKSVCHAAFGEVDGVGLYPFNEDALINMLRRVDGSFDQKFNPRILVKDVLAEVLGNYGDDLREGWFPSLLLLNQMQGRKLPPIVQDQLQQQNPAQADRQLAILELWGHGGTQPTDLAYELYAAFGTTKPRLQGAVPQRTPEPDIDSVAPQTPSVNPVVSAIRSWGNGAEMQDNLAGTLRPLVFDSIVSNIDWDMCGFVQGYFAGTSSRIFDKAFSVRFARQLTQANPRPVSITIPGGNGHDELREASMALEGLYQFRQHGNWDFPEGRDLFVAYANCLDRWSAEVLEGMRAYRRPRRHWDPAAAAVEMLMVGAAMAGKTPRARSADYEWLNAIFTEWPEELPDRSQQWQLLYKSIKSDRGLLTDFVRATASGSKGGQRGQFIDPMALIPAIKRVRRRWELSGSPPKGLRDQQSTFGRFARLDERIRTNLSAAANVEWHQSTDWAVVWNDKFGPEISGRKAIAEIRGLMNLALGSGISHNLNDRQTLEAALVDMDAAQLDEALREAASLLEGGEPQRRIPVLAKGGPNSFGSAVGRLIPSLERILNQLENSVANRAATSSSVEGELREDQARIEASLRRMISGLELMEDSHVAVQSD